MADARQQYPSTKWNRDVGKATQHGMILPQSTILTQTWDTTITNSSVCGQTAHISTQAVACVLI